MKAQILESPLAVENRPLALTEAPIPEPGPGQVRIRVAACGVCRTDLHIVEGDLDLPRLPVIPGHQAVGLVDELGDSVTIHKTGDRVGVSWLHSACGACPYCLSGRENLCEGAQFTGYTVDGGYAQYMVAPEEFVYSLPGSFPDAEVAPLLCAGVIGYRSLRLSEVQEGQTLGMYGFGGSAHVVIQVATHLGCQVHVFTRGREHQNLARRLGAAWAGRSEEGRPQSLDGAIVFAPAGHLVPAALKHVRRGSTVALAGIYMTPIPEMRYDLIYGERILRSVANSTRRDVQELMKYAAKIPIRTEVELFPLDQANRALKMLKDSAISGAAVLQIP